MSRSINWSSIAQPLVDIFSATQVQMMLLAWLPLKFGDVFTTGIYAVDMFLVTLVATSITVLLSALQAAAGPLYEWLTGKWRVNGSLSVQVDYFRQGPWGEDMPNTHYTALAWMISHASRGLDTGAFVVIPQPVYESQDKPLEFSILPQHFTKCTVEMRGDTYDLAFQQQQAEGDSRDNRDNDGAGKAKIPPSIVITPRARRDVAWFSEFVTSVTEAYKADERSRKQRGRYELDENGNSWNYVLKLHSHRGLDAVALDKEQQHLLRHDLDTFIADRDFYRNLGIPFKRGYLLSGKPGTGKTSLVHAIAAEFSRDIYYLNLRCIKSDAQLQSAFSRVPENSVIVFEDVDAMSKVVHRRDRKKEMSALAALLGDDSAMGISSTMLFGNDDDAPVAGPKPKGSSSGFGMGGLGMSGPFTLSALLNALDGHVMESGNIVIMTTNHPELLDPALIRPGRIDLHLELGYVTRYQVRRMYENVVLGDREAGAADRPALDEEWLMHFPEHIVPPCDAMRVMILYRREAHLIPVKMDELAAKYSSGAMSAEEEDELRRRLEQAALDAKEKDDKEENADEEADNDDSEAEESPKKSAAKKADTKNDEVKSEKNKDEVDDDSSLAAPESTPQNLDLLKTKNADLDSNSTDSAVASALNTPLHGAFS